METGKKNIIVLGSGFGGMTAALALAKKIPDTISLILVDRHHHQLYTPSLYEIASIPREVTKDTMLKSSILIDIKDVIRNRPITFLCDEFTGLNPQEKTIHLQKNGTLSYEYLIIALGSETAYFDIPGLHEYGLTLKTFDDALRLRNAIEDAHKKKDSLRIVVGGAGSAGIELVAEFVNFVCLIKDRITRTPSAPTAPLVCAVFFTLVEAAPDILPGFNPWIVAKAKKRLESIGIRIKVNTSISSVSEQELIYKNGDREPYDILIWSGGVKGPSLLRTIGLGLSLKDSLLVDEFLRVKDGDGRIFAIGDNATFINPRTQKPLVWNVPVAQKEAKIAATNIIAALTQKPLMPFVPEDRYPFILAVGKKYAIADLVIIRFSGFIGWVTKQLVQLYYLLSLLPLAKALNTWLRSIFVSNAND